MLVILLAFRQSLHLEGGALFDRGNRAVAVLACESSCSSAAAGKASSSSDKLSELLP